MNSHGVWHASVTVGGWETEFRVSRGWPKFTQVPSSLAPVLPSGLLSTYKLHGKMALGDPPTEPHGGR